MPTRKAEDDRKPHRHGDEELPEPKQREGFPEGEVEPIGPQSGPHDADEITPRILQPADYRDPREENPPDEPRSGNMPSNETFTQYGDLPERLAENEVEWSEFGMPIQKDNQDHDPNHSLHGHVDIPDPEPAVTHPEESEKSDPNAHLKRHGDDVDDEDNTPVAGTDLTKKEAEEAARKEDQRRKK